MGSRSVAKASYDISARFIHDLEETLFEELELWQDQKTRDQKKAVALGTFSTKWQEGIDCVREIWSSDDENPFRKMFKEQKDVLPVARQLRAAKDIPDEPESDGDGAAKLDAEDNDPDGLCDADLSTLTPVQRLLRAKRKKDRREKANKEKPNVTITVTETLADGSLGLGLDDADEDCSGLILVQINRKSEKYGWEIGDRIISLNGKEIDDFDDFKNAWDGVKMFGNGVAVFGVVRFGVDLPPEIVEPKCLNCGSKGKHLKRCSAWSPLPEGETCVYFCCTDCHKEARRKQKASAGMRS